jgi:hypothetical protein
MAGPRKANGSSALHFDAIVALVESGMSIRAVCASNPEFPKLDTFEKFVSRHPERQARLRAAIAKRESGDQATGYTGRQFTDADYDSALAAIAAGRQRNSADSLTAEHPGQRMILDRAAQDPAFGSQYRAALAARHDPDRYDEAAYGLALKHLSRIDASIQVLARGLGNDLPSIEMIYRRCNDDSEFASRFDSMRTERITADTTRILAECIGSKEPSAGALKLAVLRMFEDLEFFPVSKNALDALAPATAFLNRIRDGLTSLPGWRARVTRALAESEREHADYVERRAAQAAYERSLVVRS